MSSVFTRIIAGELPGRIVHSDDRCVVLMTIAPITPGHALVIPREEVDLWTDLAPDLVAHLTLVAHRVGQAQVREFGCERVALVIAGFEVPHVHLHVIPAHSMADIDFHRADPSADPAALDEAAERLRIAVASPTS